MIINFLTGSLIFRRKKTGVHIVHEMLSKKILENSNNKFLCKISCYGTQKELSEYTTYYSGYSNCSICYSHKFVRLLAYFLPIEFFFGKADLYICDGLIPITLFKTKKLAIIHDLMVKIYPENYSLLKRVYLNYFFYRCQKADRVLAVSESTKADIIKYLGISEDIVDVVYNGFQSEPLVNADRVFKRQSERYLFYIGDMRKNKNLLNAIKAVELAAKYCNELKLYIAGNKAFEYNNLKNYVIEHGLESNVQFLGFIDDEEKRFFYKNALGLIFVSLYEGFGLPIIEAASYNCPVITSNVSSMREIAQGRCVIVDPNSPEDICKGILYVLNPANRNKIIAKQKELVQKYTWDNTYTSFLECINKTMKG